MRSTFLPSGARRLALAAALLAFAAATAACSTSHPMVGGDLQAEPGLAALTDFRARNRLPPVAPDPVLEQAALRQAGYMAAAGAMAHATGFGYDFASRMHAVGVETLAAENVAAAGDAARAFELWEASPPHRRNMLDPRFAHFGLASAVDKSGKRYWALVLGR